MAVFIGLGGQGAEITFCSFQALITTTSLVRFYERGVGEGRYFRLDYDPKYLGEMFREPLPHLHVVPHGEPRILVPCHTSTNLVADMFDFLYRQFFYPQWSNWMHQVWDTERRRRNISLSQDPLWAIEDAFRRGKLSYLRTAEKYLDWLRAALHEHKDAAFPLRISSSDHTLTAYW